MAHLGNTVITGELKVLNGIAGGTITAPLNMISGSANEFNGAPPYILGIEPFASGGEVKWKGVDNTVTQSSSKLITSGAVYTAIDAAINQVLNASY